MILLAVGFGCLVWAGAMFLFGRYAVGRNEITLVEREKQPEFAVLIPARDESAVIEGLLKSLEEQTVKVKTEDVYVIVEAEDDPTVGICRKHGVGVFVRPKVTLSRARKGFALDEVIREILSKRRYDLYFILTRIMYWRRSLWRGCWRAIWRGMKLSQAIGMRKMVMRMRLRRCHA